MYNNKNRFAKENVLRFLVGNKCDLENKRQVSYEQGKELAKQYGIQFLETSAKDTINIEDLFILTTKCFLEKQNSGSIKKENSNTLFKKDKPSAQKGKNISLEQLSTPPKKGGCCGGSKSKK
jgi:GTPase SAR1 family protein